MNAQSINSEAKIITRFLHLVLLTSLFCFSAFSHAVSNLALSGTASQSSESSGGAASRAIDGNTSGEWGNNSTTHTADAAESYWQVDLGQDSFIDTVNVYNRTDCCGARLSGFYVLISDTAFVSSSLAGARGEAHTEYQYTGTVGSSATINMGANGRYVRIQLYNDGVSESIVSLAEVQVMGLALPNLALAGTASLSVEYNTGWDSAPKPIDGNTASSDHAEVSHTDSHLEPWWQVDLGKQAYIGEIDVYGRIGQSAQNENFYVLVSDQPFSGVQDNPSTLAINLAEADFTSGPFSYQEVRNVPVGINGRYVRLRRNDTNYFTLREVVVSGSSPNLALAGTATHRDNYNSGSHPAPIAIDGTTSSADNSDKNSIADATSQNWWQVDLGQQADIDSISVYGRTDNSSTYADQSQNYSIFVSDTPFSNGNLAQSRAEADFEYQQGTYSGTVNIPVGISGQYVRIQRSDSYYLSLAEVQVFGDYIPMDPAASTLSVTTNNATADGASKNIVLATILDFSGSGVQSAEVNFSANNGAIIDSSCTTNASGQCSVDITSTTSGGSSVSATVAGVALNNSQNVNFVAVVVFEPTNSNLVVTNDNVSADGSSDHAATATIRDASNTLLSDVTVIFYATNGASIGASCVTAATGKCTVYITSTTVGGSTITATVSGDALNNSPTVTFQSLAVTSSIAVSTNNVPADGLSANTVEATIQNASNNPVSGITVSFFASNDASVEASCVTATSGKCTVNVTSPTVGDSSVTAMVAGDALTSKQVTFIEPPKLSLLVITKNLAYADGESINTMRVTIYDVDSDLVEGETVTFSAANGAVLSAETCVTDEFGQCSVDVTRDRSGSILVSAVDGSGKALRGSPQAMVFIEALSLGFINIWSILMLITFLGYRKNKY